MAGAVRPESPIAALAADLDRSVAEGFRAAKASGDPAEQPACRRGCAFCCHQLVPLTIIEAQRIATHLATLPRGERRDLGQAVDRQSARFADWVQRFHPGSIQDRRTNLDYLRQGIPCPFLGKENECRIYPVRPLICRGHHALGTSENCQSAEQPIRVIPAVERATAAATESARDFARAMGASTVGGLISTFAPLFQAALKNKSQN